MAELELCRTCSQALPDDAPWGLCPACLLGQAIEGDTEGPLLTEDSDSSPADLDSLSAIPPGKIDDEGRTADFPEFVGRYRLEREIGRGGMGQVILGLDVEIGRAIALKVLIQKYRDSEKMTLRFVEEAQIGGQLVHPAIVPVYERGTFPDGRPFFVMKLVEGRTLADLLHARSNPAEDLPRFLSIFDQVCQAMAYAHSRRVIHRDLKSPNVMVGAFGEVQTMDWGMAKLISREGEPTIAGAIRTIRDGSLVTVDGSVKGTPNYMSPEQARGEGDRLDERTDVFSLGAILCEILTGRPPYVGETSEEILAKAAKADLADALAELVLCGADVELQALARHCLAIDPDDRPSNAGEVATAMAGYFQGVQDRLRQAELDRVEAETRAQEESKRRVLADNLADEAEGRAASERKRRRLQVGLAAAVLALTAMGGLGTALIQQQRAARTASIAKVIGVASTMLEVARATPENIARWRTAQAAVQQAEGVAGDDPEALRLVGTLRNEVKSGLDAAERDKTLLDRIVEIRSSRSDDPEGTETDATYAEAFQDAGLDLATLPPAEAGAKIKARPTAVAVAIAAALDDWSAVRESLKKDPAFAGRLTEVARVADPDVWRNNLRATLLLQDRSRRQEAMKALFATAKFSELGPTSLILLGQNVGDPAMAETVMRQAQRYYPDDVWVNFGLASLMGQRHRRDDALRFYTAARALRPETAHDLAHLLANMGDSSEGIEVFQELVRLRPENSRNLCCLGNMLMEHGRSKEGASVLDQAAAVCRKRIGPKSGSFVLHFYLGNALQAQGHLDEAIAEYRKAIEFKPDDPVVHNNLGNTLKTLRRFDEAITAINEAIRLQPGYAEAHSNLGAVFQMQGRFDKAEVASRKAIELRPDLAVPHNNLGIALKGQRRLDEAVAEYRKAVELKPDFDSAYSNLGAALYDQGKVDEAVIVLVEAVRLQPGNAKIRSNLGTAFLTVGRVDDAVVQYREAMHLNPELPFTHFELGDALKAQGHLEEAVAEFRKTIELKPDDAMAHSAIGSVLRTQADYAGSLAMTRKAHELGSKQPGWRYPSAQWVAEAERQVALADRLPAVLKGDDKPTTVADQLALAQICCDKKLYGSAAQFYSSALEGEPILRANRNAQHCYNAACAAALAASGLGKDDPPPDEAAKVKLRGQVLEWLKYELKTWTKFLASGDPVARPFIAQTLLRWQHDSDLAGIRDTEALAMLPEAERKEWQALWTEVEALLKQVKEKSQ